MSDVEWASLSIVSSYSRIGPQVYYHSSLEYPFCSNGLESLEWSPLCAMVYHDHAVIITGMLEACSSAVAGCKFGALASEA